MGQINLLGTLKDQDVLRVVRDGSGNPIYLTDMDGNVIVPTDTVETFPDLLNIPKIAVYNGLVIFVKQVGVNGSLWRYDHPTLSWLNPNPILLYSDIFGTMSAPTVSNGVGVTGVTKFVLPSDPKFPANMLSSKARFGVRAGIVRSSAINATCNMKIYFGKTSSASDSPIYAGSMQAVANHCLPAAPFVEFSGSSEILSTNATAGGASTSNTGTFVTQSTNIDRSSDMFISVVSEAKNTNDVFSLMHLSVMLEAA